MGKYTIFSILMFFPILEQIFLAKKNTLYLCNDFQMTTWNFTITMPHSTKKSAQAKAQCELTEGNTFTKAVSEARSGEEGSEWEEETTDLDTEGYEDAVVSMHTMYSAVFHSKKELGGPQVNSDTIIQH